MTREELIAYDRWLTENNWGSSEIVTPEKAADIYLAKHPLPPAEGAEANRANIDDLIKKHIPIDAANFEYCAKHNIINGGLLQGIRDVVNSFMKPQPTAEGAEKLKEMEELFNLEQQLDIPMKDRFHNSAKGKELFAAIQNKPHPTAEGAEEILTSLIKSLGEPTKIHNHIYEIRPYTVEGKTEWWMFHNGVGSGEPLAQWLQNFATLPAQQMAEKMVEERLKNAPKNCPKAAQCAHVEGGMKCPPNVICPI